MDGPRLSEVLAAEPQRELTFEQLATERLRVGDRIGGLLDSRAIDTLEVAAATSIFGDRGGIREGSISKVPLARELRPKLFHGGLVHGVAVVVSTDMEWINTKLQRHEDNRLRPGQVLSVVVGADMLSGGGVRGHVALSATYFERSQDKNPVGRRVGAREQAMGQAIASAIHVQSRMRGYLAEVEAVRHPASAGLPSHGRLHQTDHHH
jgi:hypothetical protein